MDLNSIQKQLEKEMFEKNYRSVPEFEGYSPFEMHHILHFTFGENSPIKLQDISDYKKVPIFNQAKYLLNLIADKGELKLTNRGFLPTKVVSELYQQGFLKDYHIELGISKLRKETDSKTIALTRILIELAGLVKKRSGKLSLTKVGEKTLKDNGQLFKAILETFTSKFNWAYFDWYGDNRIGQLGYGYTLILLSKYGHEKQLDSFYAEKYFKAFPQLIDSIASTYGTKEDISMRCYSYRIFEIFLDYLGFIKIEKIGKGFDYVNYISKTDLFDELMKVQAHKKG